MTTDELRKIDNSKTCAGTSFYKFGNYFEGTNDQRIMQCCVNKISSKMAQICW